MNLPEATLIEQLPVEVLRHIAAFCPPHCLLSLCSASHALRSACYDSLTFKQLIANAYLSEQSPPFHLLCQHLGLETQAWARYAVALSRESSCDFSCAATWDAAPAPGRFENYLPQLFVSGCHTANTQCSNLGPPRTSRPLQRKFSVWSPGMITNYFSPDSDPRVALCYAMALVNMDPDLCLADDFTAFLASLKPMRVVYAYGLKDTQQWKLYRIIGAFAIALKALGDKYPLAKLPSTARIPFASFNSFQYLPLPFEQNSESAFLAWLKQHTSHMVDPDFLTDGEWCGYYSVGWEMNCIDPPMMSVQFSVELDRISPEGDLAIKATGQDSVGAFSLVGSISKTGLAQLKKHYANMTWNWFCAMTPFGICGVWRHPEHVGYGGLLWLWKTEWCAV